MQGAISYFVVFGWTWTEYLVTSLLQELDATIFIELRKLDVVFKYTMFTSALCTKKETNNLKTCREITAGSFFRLKI